MNANNAYAFIYRQPDQALRLTTIALEAALQHTGTQLPPFSRGEIAVMLCQQFNGRDGGDILMASLGILLGSIEAIDEKQKKIRLLFDAEKSTPSAARQVVLELHNNQIKIKNINLNGSMAHDAVQGIIDSP